METIKDFRILKAIAKIYNLEFCKKHKYYTGNPYKDNKGNYLLKEFKYKNKTYSLKYFDGCFSTFLIHKTNTK